MTKRELILIGVLVVVLVIGGVFWYLRKSESFPKEMGEGGVISSEKEKLEELEIELEQQLEDLSEDIGTLEGLAQENDLESLEKDLSSLEQ